MTNVHVRHILLSLTCWVGSVGVLSPGLSADPAESGTGKSAPHLSAGQAAYVQHCARCHGITGQGDGRDAKRLYPRPRDFTSGVYKFRSTASGTSPTDEDLFQTITNGLTAGGMPDWGQLDEAVRWQLVNYLKTLSPTFTSTPPQPVSVGRDPGSTQADLARGKQVYEKLGCAACHGAQGRANGPSAATLVDTWGRAIQPANLTQGWSYRGGSDPQAIVLRVLTGMDGSPMPSYVEAASTDEVWQLAYYVHSLQQEPRWAIIVRVPHVSGVLPSSPDDPRWVVAQRADVQLRNVVNATGEMAAPQTVTAVSFQAVHHDEAISMRVSWDDPSDDQGEPSDGFAVVLRPPEVVGDTVTLQAWPLRDSPPLDLCVWSAHDAQAREAVTTSYEAVLQGRAPTRPLASHAAYDDGRRTLVLIRSLSSPGLEGAAQLSTHRFIPVAFTVWDGGNAGGQAVSMWVDLVLQGREVASSKPDRSLTLVWVISGIVLVLALGLSRRKS